MKFFSRNLFIGMSVVLGLSVGVSVGWAQSGSLEPPGTAVNGSGDPVATTQTQPSWDQSLRADNGDANGCNSTRFKCVLPTSQDPTGAAVLDKETGLVWARSPGTGSNWQNARVICTSNLRAKRLGWRLPSVHELTSLVVQIGIGGPFSNDPIGGLPVGHPFSNVQDVSYWSATTSVHNPTNGWSVRISGIFPGAGVGAKTGISGIWCVRGGGPLSEY